MEFGKVYGVGIHQISERMLMKMRPRWPTIGTLLAAWHQSRGVHRPRKVRSSLGEDDNATAIHQSQTSGSHNTVFPWAHLLHSDG